ncbi:hypothetical protein IE53DRAFT_254828 [Violaceomyces palustris]|uniref:Uncharacterized protein n=1 Tax=Violaceomyces palustris TaxID=1673888 RepID=A0ACD0NNG4_9BASI|nr:hypothetical protein IE53DRAFT_254828 [Violaceomyces palustris]
MPFSSQFFHDDGFDPMGGVGGSSEVGNEDEEEEEELQTQVLNRIRPEYVNYAKKAKRVDVKKLKENIWNELGIFVDPSQSLSPDSLTKQEPKRFESVLKGLRKAYPKDRMEEISTSFCFICLLHLANEEGLEINTGQDPSSRSKSSIPSGGGAKNPMTNIQEEEDDPEGTPRPNKIVGGVGNQRVEKDQQDLPTDNLLENLSRRGGVIPIDEDDDRLGGEWEEEEDQDEDEIKVGRLEFLTIVKDPKAYRSA